MTEADGWQAHLAELEQAIAETTDAGQVDHLRQCIARVRAIIAEVKKREGMAHRGR